MDLDDVALFRAITTVGSLSAAARRLGTTAMLVSRRLAGLEAELGVRLFHRTTRSLSLTPEGEAFLPHAVTLLETRDAAFDSLSSGAGLTGVLKVTATNIIGHSIIVPVVAELLAENPGLRAELTLSDSVVDIATAGLDVAVRVGVMKPSDLIATRIADNPLTLCASPAYIARFGRPETSQELASHPCIRLHGYDLWPFKRGAETHRVRIAGSLSANTLDAVRAACVAGAGITIMSYWDVYREIERGELRPITLADVEPYEGGMWAVFSTRTHMPGRVRAFIQALRARLAAARPSTPKASARDAGPA